MQQFPLEPIRRAVTSGEFARAQLLWNECAAALEGDARRGSLTEARLTEVRQLVEWSRIVVLCERARLRDRLNGLHVAGEYEHFVASPTHRLVSASL